MIYRALVYCLPLHTFSRLNSHSHLMISRISGLLLLFFLSLSFKGSAQTETIVFDGYTGVLNFSIQSDTVMITTILPNSPAERAGLKFRDQVIAINDSVVAGTGIGRRGIQDLVRMESGKEIKFLIKRRGEDALLLVSFPLGSYLHAFESYEFEYLI